MVFLGLVMMPFYYGRRCAACPSTSRRRFDDKTQRLQAVLFALASVLLAGVNLYAMAIVVNALLGWPTGSRWSMAGVVVLLYTFLGGLSAAIYNEVLQFFVIVATMIPVTLVGLHRVGGWHGLTSRLDRAAGRRRAATLNPFPAHELTGIGNTVGSVRRRGARPRVRDLVRLLDDELRGGAARVLRQETSRRPSARPLIAAIPKIADRPGHHHPRHDRRPAGPRHRRR